MIRQANNNDIESILEIVHDAQLALRDLGIDQWQDGYPGREVIESDIAKHVGWVYIHDDAVVGYAAIIFDGEEAYNQIDIKEWNTTNDYVAIHRICVGGKYRRHGLATNFMAHAANMARNRNINGFRIDTHRGNTRMLSLLERLGFDYVGIVRYDSGERMAFDLRLDDSKIL